MIFSQYQPRFFWFVWRVLVYKNEEIQGSRTRKVKKSWKIGKMVLSTHVLRFSRRLCNQIDFWPIQIVELDALYQNLISDWRKVQKRGGKTLKYFCIFGIFLDFCTKRKFPLHSRLSLHFRLSFRWNLRGAGVGDMSQQYITQLIKISPFNFYVYDF